MVRRTEDCTAAFDRARRVLVGGVNSPVRAFNAVGGTPATIAKAKGARVTDIDGNTYVDYVGSYGPAILGHAPPSVVKAIVQAARRGTSYGAPTEVETVLAEMIVAAMPAFPAGRSIEKVRFTSSGTEAVMTAVRLARGATGRSKIVKCIGCYHGHSDALLVSAGSGALTLGVPSSPGVPPGATAETVLVPFNSVDAIRQAFAQWDKQIAAVLLEPVVGNMGVVVPAEGYLPELRRLCDEHGALLIFDEVMTGFRVSYAGAQGLYNVRADLTTLGKIIGGGMPVGAVGGPCEIMKHLAPEGPVYQAGTLSGNPVAMAAGIATLRELQTPGFYELLELNSAALESGLREAAGAKLADRICLNRVGSMMTVFFAPPPVTDYASATRSSTRAFAAWFHSMLDRGVYLPPSQYEALFVSAAHGDADIAKTVRAARRAFAAAGKLL
jgi:glutamate-1-semialdehyde 2,1-aminomutase